MQKNRVWQNLSRRPWVLHPADGFYEGNGLLVSWCVGHLVSPMDAGGYDENFKKWRYDDLPILPEPFRYVLTPGKEAHLKIYAP